MPYSLPEIFQVFSFLVLNPRIWKFCCSMNLLDSVNYVCNLVVSSMCSLLSCFISSPSFIFIHSNSLAWVSHVGSVPLSQILHSSHPFSFAMLYSNFCVEGFNHPCGFFEFEVSSSFTVFNSSSSSVILFQDVPKVLVTSRTYEAFNPAKAWREEVA
jgi:hypothetical protein